MKGFIEFIREQSVVGLAIGFILGGAISKLVSALVNDIINPLIGLALGSVDTLDNAVLKIGNTSIMYGHFLGALIDFVVIAFVVYVTFRRIADKIDKKRSA